MSITTLTETLPEDRLDLLRAELRVWIDRARPVLKERLVTGDSLIPYGAALAQVELIDRLVFGQPALGPDDAEQVNLQIMTLKAFDPTPDEEVTRLLTKVSGLFHLIDERVWPEHAPPRETEWGADDPRPAADPALVAEGKRSAFALALAHQALVDALRGRIDPAPVAPGEAWERIDEIRAFSLLRLVTAGTSSSFSEFRRATRLALASDPSEIEFLGTAYHWFRVTAERNWSVEDVVALDEELGGAIGHFDAVANQVSAALSEVPAVYGRPVPPPAPEDRGAELALYRLALSHGRLRNVLAGAAAGGDGAAPAPWPAALAALASGAGEVEGALLAALADPSPRYGKALRLGRQWSAYDETVGRLPLGTLSAEGRAEVEALAGEVAGHARAVVAAADAAGTE